MAVKIFHVPSLFAGSDWQVELGTGAEWDDLWSQWKKEGMIGGYMGAHNPVNLNQDYVLQQPQSFRFLLARTGGHFERAGQRPVLPLPSFSAWGSPPTVQTSIKIGAGVFRKSRTWLYLCPAGESLNERWAFPSLHPAGLAPVVTSARAWTSETCAFFHELDEQPGESNPWYALTRTMTRQGPAAANLNPVLKPGIALDPLNYALREVRGTLFGSQPFQGLVPWFESPDEDFDPISLIGLYDRSARGPRNWGTRLLKLELGAGAAGKRMHAHVDWFWPARDGDASVAPTGFTIEGKLYDNGSDPQFKRAWGAGGTAQLEQVEGMLGDQRRDIAHLQLRGCTIVARPAGNEGWLRLGSMEWRPVDVVRENGKSVAQLDFSVDGELGSGANSLFPKSSLRKVLCEVRYAAGEDTDPEWVMPGGSDDGAQRESTPIVHRLLTRVGGAMQGDVLRGELSITTQYGLGLNALTEIRIEVTRKTAERGSAFWLNLRPFMAARIDFPNSDNERTVLIWRSDDPQWRVEDPIVSVTMPPQSVVEAMERGDRFYGANGKPRIQADRPVAHRFSPGTYVELRPSPPAENRRFERSPVNFRALMRSSYVERLAFEMAYPLSVVYQRPQDPQRDVMVKEAGEFFGTPSERVTLQGDATDLRESGLPMGLDEFLSQGGVPSRQKYLDAVRLLMRSQDSARTNFVNRLAELHVVDAARPRETLQLTQDLSIRLRDHATDAVPLADPLPAANPLPLGGVSAAFARFLKNGDWASDADGAVRGGLIHSFEMPSELIEVLETPKAVAGMVEALTLSALGATGSMEASFASGKTSFAVVVDHGQLSRLVKTRIGRIGALWNKAKHVIVYERTVEKSAQLQDEQSQTNEFRGWPVLRKAEEYIEPLQPERNFYEEAQKDSNTTGFIRAAVFASPRIYVNGAWARDLGDGYELPLWDRTAAEANAKFYPRPRIYLECFGEEDRLTKLWFSDPDRLYFHTSTAPEAKADTDAWPPRAGIDFENMPRWGITEASRQPNLGRRTPASRELCTSWRFDLAVEAEGPVNLQHGRGKTPMLVTLDRVSISRTSQSAPQDVAAELGKPVQTVQAAAAVQQTARALAPDLAQLAGDLTATIRRSIDFNEPCSNVAQGLRDRIDAAHVDLQKQLDPLTHANLQLATLLDRGRDAWARMFADVHAQLLARAMIPDAVLEARVASLRASIVSLRSRLDPTPGMFSDLLKREVKACAEDVQSLANDAKARLHDQLAVQADTAQKALAEIVTAVNAAATDLTAAAGDLAAGSAAARARLDVALAHAAKVPIHLRGPLEPAVNWLKFAAAQLDTLGASSGLIGRVATGIAADVGKALADLATDIGKIAGLLDREFASELQALAASAEKNLQANFLTQAAQHAAAVADAAAQQTAQAAITALTAADQAVSESGGSLKAQYRAMVAEADSRLLAVEAKVLKALCDDVVKPLDQLAGKIQALGMKLPGLADTVRDVLIKAVNDAQGQCEAMLQNLTKELRTVQEWGRRQGEDLLADVMSSEAARQIERSLQTAQKAYDVGSKALSLARAVGDLPKVTPLEFDIDIAAYVFDGAKPQIRMTPAVATLLRQGEEVLEAVGLRVPCQELVDQFMPDIPAGYKFEEIFPKFIAKFDGLFSKFRLPTLDGNNVKVTHGFDKKTRRAWVDANVAFSHPAYEELFEWGPVAVGLERLAMEAYTGVETRLMGDSVQSTNRTRATLLGDWVLMGGGQRLVTFKQVALKFDGGSGFDFDVKPENIELHPALKFVGEFIERFKKNLPPAIQIIEEDGRPVGVSAGTTIIIDDLPDLGAVSIGPIDMRSSLGLRLMPHQGLAIESAFSLGNKQAPIFVQVTWLGGGCWLEARASYLEGKVTPAISIGLSLGAIRSFNLAGVARGSFSVLLFCAIEIHEHESITVGLSLIGSATIIGFVNANLNLLLEANHSQGKTEGTGRLDVEVKISWFYTFRFKRAVKHNF
jgi:hypothetical protein